MTGTKFDYGMVREPEALECFKNIDSAMTTRTCANVTAVTLADATAITSCVLLVNSIKAQFNKELAAMKACLLQKTS